MDEAKRLGIGIDPAALARELGVPVVPMAARRGEGVDALRAAIQEVARGQVQTSPYRVRNFSPDIEEMIGEVEEAVLRAAPDKPNSRWVALRLLNADERVEASGAGRGAAGRERGALAPEPRLPGPHHAGHLRGAPR